MTNEPLTDTALSSLRSLVTTRSRWSTIRNVCASVELLNRGIIERRYPSEPISTSTQYGVTLYGRLYYKEVTQQAAGRGHEVQL